MGDRRHAMTENKSETRPIRVAIIEDQRDVRDGLALLINSTAGYRCLHKYSSAEDALADIGDSLPDVLLADIGLPGMSGIEVVRQLKQLYPKLLCLMLTVYKDDERIFEAICAGASGYLLKKTPPARLLESVREAFDGGAPMSPEIARRVIELFQRVQPSKQAPWRLSPQELRLLKLLGEGHHYKTAAAELGISIHTVAFHMRNLYEKLHVHSKSEAVAKALRAGLVR